MKTVQRIDFQTMPLAKPIKTDAGFLRVPIRATRVGVFDYVQADGSVRKELRPAEEVFDEESMKTLQAVPVTVRHPKEMVTTKNVRGLSVGMIGDSVVKSEDRFLDTTATITDERAVKSLEKKNANNEGQEVSCGYTADMDFTPGIWNGIHYDAIQRNIRYNHVALVDRGRAGPEVRVKLDENDNAFYHTSNLTNEGLMKTIRIDGKDYEVSNEAFDAITSLQTKMDAMTKDMGDMKKKKEEDEMDLKKMKKEKDEMEAKKDSLETEVASLKEASKENKVDHAQLDAMVAERTSIVEVASSLINDFKKDGKSNLDIKKEVIASVSSDLKLDEKSEDYINARFDAVAEKSDLYKDHLKAAMQTRADSKQTTETKVDAEAARQNMVNESKEAWKQPLN